jgi:outer membrane protein OmpA-like peptidoglycan-associated protein
VRPPPPPPPGAQPPRPPGAPVIPPAAQNPPRPGPQPAAPSGSPIVAPNRPDAHRLDQLRTLRKQEQIGGRTVIQEPGRTIIREGDRTIIRHDDADRFRRGARDVQVVRRGADVETVIVRPDGSRIIDVVDGNGRLLRRVRRDPNGREIIIIDSRPVAPGIALQPFVQLPPPVIRIPRDRYIVDAVGAGGALIYDTLVAPPVERLSRAYSLDEIRFSEPVRERMPRIDIDTITFETGSWEIAPNQGAALEVIAQAMTRAIQQNPRTVFLIEGHTDAVGQDIDNLSLSDRRAEAVAELLTSQFGVPPENLVTQGYGSQYLKIPTNAAERRNRRVSVRNITPLMTGAAAPPR